MTKTGMYWTCYLTCPDPLPLEPLRTPVIPELGISFYYSYGLIFDPYSTPEFELIGPPEPLLRLPFSLEMFFGFY